MNNKIHNSGSKSPTTSSLDSGDELGPKVNNVLTTEHEKNLAVADPKDSNMSKNRKRVDRSSCGSNSSNDLETVELKKHDKTKEETKEADASQTATESSSRRSKNPSSFNDSRKEGRMAFRALFLREVLPQSFSPPYDGKNKAAEQQHTKKTDVEENMPNVEVSNENASQLDLNSNTIEIESWSNHHDTVNRLAEDINVKEGLLTIGLAQRTCFKPYKRCCVEARESGVPNTSCQDQEKTPNAYAWERKLQAKN